MPRQQLLQVGMGHKQIRLCCQPGKSVPCTVAVFAGASVCLLRHALPDSSSVVLQGGGYLTTPTIPVCTAPTHRATTIETAVHAAHPMDRTINPDRDSAVVRTRISSLGAGPSSTDSPLKSCWAQAGCNQSTPCVDQEDKEDDDDNDDDDARGANSSSRSVHYYQYHVVYLPSYAVPVLLFKAHNEGKCKLLMTATFSMLCILTTAKNFADRAAVAYCFGRYTLATTSGLSQTALLNMLSCFLVHTANMMQVELTFTLIEGHDICTWMSLQTAHS